MRVNIVDALMGTGKSSALINHINNSDKDAKFLYITPYLTEVTRVIEKCPDKGFKQPEIYGSKINGIKHLFEKGCNIASTHSLFRLFDKEIIDLAFNNGYTLIMDEVADVIAPLSISKDDLDTILEKYTEIGSDYLLKWTAQEYQGEFEKYKRLCDLDCIGIYNNAAILWLFPVSVFHGFKEIYISTYLFNAQMQKYYFDLYNITYNYLYIEGDHPNTYSLTDIPIKYDYLDYKFLIHIVENDKLNRIGEMETSMSSSWYQRNQNNVLMNTLKNNVGNFFKNYTKTKTQFNLWTTFKDYKPIVSGKGYAKGFLPSNKRATNEYKDRTAVAYLVNKYFNPHIKNFFSEKGIKVNEEAYALSEMLQFIWRSAIREKRGIWVYCPSRRMRELLKSWADNIANINISQQYKEVGKIFSNKEGDSQLLALPP